MEKIKFAIQIIGARNKAIDNHDYTVNVDENTPFNINEILGRASNLYFGKKAITLDSIEGGRNKLKLRDLNNIRTYGALFARLPQAKDGNMIIKCKE